MTKPFSPWASLGRPTDCHLTSHVRAREVACHHSFRVQLRELSNFHQLIPTQEGSMGWDDQTFLSLSQSRTANGLAFDFTKPLSRWASPGQAADRLSTSYVMSFVLSFASWETFALFQAPRRERLGWKTKPFSPWASPGLAVDRTTHPAGPIHAAGAIGAVWKVSADLV